MQINIYIFKMNTQKRILKLESAGFSMSKISEETGIDYSIINRIRNGKTKNPGELTVTLVSEFYSKHLK